MTERWLLFTLIIHDDKWTEGEPEKRERHKPEPKGGDRTHHGQHVERPGSGIWTQVADGAWAPAGDRVGVGQGAGFARR